MAASSNTVRKINASMTQAERTALSDRAMLDAAVELILNYGTDKTTLAKIGENAGYSRGLATYRFGSKAGLYDALCKSISRDWLEYLKRGVGNKFGVDAMCAALDAIHAFVTENPREGRVLQILYAAAASPSSEFRETTIGIHRRQQSDVVEWVRRGQALGRIRPDVDPQHVAAKYVAYTTGMTYLWLISPESFSFKKANEEMKRELRLSLSDSGVEDE